MTSRTIQCRRDVQWVTGRSFRYASVRLWNQRILSSSPDLSRFTSSFTCQAILVIITTFTTHHSFTLSLHAQSLPFQQILPTFIDLEACSTVHRSNGPDHWDGLMLDRSAVWQLSSLTKWQRVAAIAGRRCVAWRQSLLLSTPLVPSGLPSWITGLDRTYPSWITGLDRTYHVDRFIFSSFLA